MSAFQPIGGTVPLTKSRRENIQKIKECVAPLLVILAIHIVVLARSAIADSSKILRPANYPSHVIGSCEEFVQAANGNSQPLRDPNGTSHKGACGYTEFRPLFSRLDGEGYVDSVLKGLIDPPFKTEHIKDTGRFCVRAFDFSIDLEAQVQVSMLDWNHKKKPDSECAKEWQRLKLVISNHEEKHVRDAKLVIDAAAARMRQLNIISCAASDEKATENLSEMIRSELGKWNKSIDDDWNVRQRSRDKSGIDRCEINCSKCATSSPQKTYCPCDNPGQGKPKNYATESECAARCSSGLGCFGVQCTVSAP